jgi:hypothetical protein
MMYLPLTLWLILVLMKWGWSSWCKLLLDCSLKLRICQQPTIMYLIMRRSWYDGTEKEDQELDNKVANVENEVDVANCNHPEEPNTE